LKGRARKKIRGAGKKGGKEKQQEKSGEGGQKGKGRREKESNRSHSKFRGGRLKKVVIVKGIRVKPGEPGKGRTWVREEKKKCRGLVQRYLNKQKTV